MLDDVLHPSRAAPPVRSAQGVRNNGVARGARLEAMPAEVIAFIYRHLEAGTFRKPVLHEWLRQHVTMGK